MKNKLLIFCSIFFIATVISCTDDFNEINEQPDALSASDLSAKYFVTDLQQGLWGANTFGMWLGQHFTCRPFFRTKCSRLCAV